MLGRDRSAVVDHGMLVASLAAHQSASRTARAEALARQSDRSSPLASDPLPELILGGRAWREAAAAQQGCFNGSIAKQRVNGS